MDEIRHWVFDLDDTLYPERDYVRSALLYVGERVEQLFREKQFADHLLELWQEGTADPISLAWSQRALPEVARVPMVTAMRAHAPAISLSDGAQAVLARLRAQRRSYAIVTDGRSVTQRAKLFALGCVDAHCLSISEEVGLTKLQSARFIAVSAAFSPGLLCYVGDNPAKDFWMPKQLGWSTIMLDHQGRGVHTQGVPDDTAYLPDLIVSDLREILPRL